MACDEQLAERVRDLIALREGVSERRMFGGTGFMLGADFAASLPAK